MNAHTPTVRLLTVAERLADLDVISAKLADEKSGGWLAKAVAESIVRELDREAAAPSEAQQLELLIGSGLVGHRFHRELWARFGATSRSEIFAGMAAGVTTLYGAVSLAQLDLVIGLAEREAT